MRLVRKLLSDAVDISIPELIKLVTVIPCQEIFKSLSWGRLLGDNPVDQVLFDDHLNTEGRLSGWGGEVKLSLLISYR